MVIHEAQKAVNSLIKVLPEAFVFVLDTTDRSFLFKSIDNEACEESVIRLDQTHGIDKLSRDGYHFGHQECSFIGVKNISINTYLGFCLSKAEVERANTLSAEEILKSLTDRGFN